MKVTKRGPYECYLRHFGVAFNVYLHDMFYFLIFPWCLYELYNYNFFVSFTC